VCTCSSSSTCGIDWCTSSGSRRIRVVTRDNETDLEVDLWAIVDGRIVIGEAKKGDVLAETEDEEIARCAALLRLARDLSAVEFVMASGASRWRERTRRNVENTLGRELTVTWRDGLK